MSAKSLGVKAGQTDGQTQTDTIHTRLAAIIINIFFMLVLLRRTCLGKNLQLLFRVWGVLQISELFLKTLS